MQKPLAKPFLVCYSDVHGQRKPRSQQRKKTMETVRIEPKPANHLYQLEVRDGKDIEVVANTSSQAIAIASKAGYEVRSVNMVG